MGSTALFQVIMMVLTVCVWRGDGAVSNTPSWPTTGCTFTRHPGKQMSGYYTSNDTLTTEDECESWCLREARCGTYTWWERSENCFLLQRTPKLLEELTGRPEEAWRDSNADFNMGSKDCEVEISDTPCANYIRHDRKGTRWTNKIAHFGQHPSQPLTSAMCQSLCDAFEACVSVYHMSYHSGWSMCSLHSVTITELIENGRENEIITNDDIGKHPIWNQYDCDISTTPTETTTPEIDCTNLTGALLCLPIGYGDEATCQAIPGCCFLEGTIAGAPYTMCMKAD